MKVVFIVGPTGSGKSDFALTLAEQLGGEILNADSVQMYKGLELGSAKPRAAERARVPHLLLDCVEEGGTYTAGDYRRDAIETLKKKDHAGIRQIFVVGGTGFYIQALERGMYPVPTIPDEVRKSLRERVQSEGVEALFKELEKLDPRTALRLARHDQYRILRALEIYYGSGRRWSEIIAEFKPQAFPYAKLKVGLRLSREDLLGRVQRRAEAMLAEGWIEEVRGLIERVGSDWAPLNSVGYREVLAYLRGDLDKHQLVPQVVNSTMGLAKRQMTWFRRDSEIKWFDALTEIEPAQQLVREWVKAT